MKGIIFTGFLEMVEEVFSLEIVDDIINSSELPNQGAYTDIGTYDYQELLRLITNLSVITGKSISELEIAYGQYLFTRLLNRYSKLVNNCNTTFDFLQEGDQHIHVEVLKLYPDAELPRFICDLKNPYCMTMEYRSNHPFADLAQGLILGCAQYFQETIHIEQQSIEPKKQMLNEVLFTLTKQG
jgi:hypothetical protein